MKKVLIPCLLLATTGCAGNHPRGFDGPPPPGGNGGRPLDARLFVSPMGEPFRGDEDGLRPQDVWFRAADRNGDGAITVDEMAADADRFFAILDRNRDGGIDPDEVAYYEKVLLPQSGGGDGPPRGGRPDGEDHGHGPGRRRPPGGGFGGGGSPPGGGQPPRGGDDHASKDDRPDYSAMGASRFGYLRLPEPVSAADTDFNRTITQLEFEAAARQRFALLDRNHDGRIVPGELPHLR
ncbi:EF-hand domain-containing protein [Hephaestia mangrovi]|uniref:EF-hand domain-containing protein n=1 Tax=Hephaestia mangrovi TaxID=2873268 RepID=UPI001CA7A576|nr:EF-hand domain-containing protein [Hephaestia mangrovi]MBY8829405.1 EF-hand domain-containing protein [Hephaestia mangrovi]